MIFIHTFQLKFNVLNATKEILTKFYHTHPLYVEARFHAGPYGNRLCVILERTKTWIGDDVLFPVEPNTSLSVYQRRNDKYDENYGS